MCTSCSTSKAISSLETLSGGDVTNFCSARTLAVSSAASVITRSL